MDIEKRYQRNMNALTPEENLRLRNFRVLVAGCGGLGGYVIEELGRLGIGRITAIDGDAFDETNLNRQLLSTVDRIGSSKAQAAYERMGQVNPHVIVTPVHGRMTEENCRELIRGHDLVVDALDNISSRLLLERHCEAEGIPLIHGAIAGWYGQVSAVFPGDRTLEKLYPKDAERGIEAEMGNPAFTPAVIASIEVGEAIKVLLNKGSLLRKRLLTVNLLDHEYEVLKL